MRSYRRVTQRVAPALASIASVLLFATCDFDKISGTPTPITQQEIDRLFSITPADTTIMLGGTTALTIAPGPNVNLAGTTQSWSSSNSAVIAITDAGLATGVSIGNATITARVIAPELDTGYPKTRSLRVRYKGIKACGVAPQCSPSSLDSLTGLNLSRAVNFFGTNNSDVRQTTALTGVTLSTRDSGATTNTVASITGSNVFARKNGAAYVIGVFESMRDSIKVRVRQVAKSLTFPTTDYTANAINVNRTVPIILRDVNDSVMTSSPVMRWRSSDATVVTIDSLTGVLRVLKKDTARIFVRVDTVNRSQKLIVRQAIASITKSAGDVASDTVGRLVTIAPTVTVVDSGSTAIQGDTVTFRVGSGGGVITDSVKLTDASGSASIGSWRLGKTAGAQTLIASSGNQQATFTVTALALRAYKLIFGQHPTSTATGAVVTPALTVEIRDSLDNLVTSATNSVTLAFGTKSNASATLGGTLTRAAVNGVATFNNVTVSHDGPGYTVVANATALSGAVSNSFDIYGAPTKLAFQTQPVGSSAGGIMQPVRVMVQDAQGAHVANATDNITLTLTNAGSATLGGTRTVAAVGGIATFSDLTVSAAGAGYTLVASAASRTSATSSAFTVNPVGIPTRLAFSVQPGNAVSGAAISPAVKVQVLDENGALVTSSSQQITMSLQDGTSVSGTSAVNASAGEATFSNLIVNKSGTGLRFVASAAGTSIASATSAAFNITPGAASKLGFTQQPTNVVVGQNIAPAVRIAVQDAQGNTVTGHPATAVTVTLTGPGCTGLSGNAPQNTTNGEVAFSVLSVSPTTFSACTLTASATGLAAATSSQFAIVTTTGAVRLKFTAQPAASTTAGTSMSGGTVNFQDSQGNNVTAPSSVSVAISVFSGPGGIACCGQTQYTTSTAQSFTGLTFNTAGTYRLLVTATGYDPDTSATFTITAGAANRLGFISQPNSIVAGVPFTNALQVAVQDQFGNTVTGATNNISINANLAESPFTGLRLNNGQFSRSETAVNGVATFAGLSVRGAGTPVRLNANTTSFGAGSNTFSVFAAPLSSLGFSQQPSQNYTAGTNLGTITVQGQDSVGNVVTTFGNSITLTLTGGNAAAVLNGTKTKVPTAGAASFTDLSINEAGSGYQLSASASGVSTATSNAFTINAAAATKLAWITQPANTFVNAPLNPAVGATLPRVEIQDQYGNNTRDGHGLRFAIVSPPAGVEIRENGGSITNNNYHPPCNQTGCSGIVTFSSNMTINGPATGIRITASTAPTAPFLTSATSDVFNVGAFDVKTKLVFTQQPTPSSYGVDFSPSVKVTIQDKYGNTDTTATNTIGLTLTTNPSAATLSSTGVAAVKGVATFSPLHLNKDGTGYVITASSAPLTSAASDPFSVSMPGLVAQHQNVCDMTRSGNTIYYVECGSAASLKSVSVFGGEITTHQIGIPNPLRITADGTNVFWIENGTANGNGQLKKMNIVSKAVTPMATGLFDLKSENSTIALDATHIYFAARNQAGTTNAIRRVAISVGGPAVPTDVFEPATTCTGCTPYFTLGSDNLVAYDYVTDRLKRIPLNGGGTPGSPVTISPAGQGCCLQMVLNGSTLIYSQGSNLKTLAGATTANSEVVPVEQIASGAVFKAFAIDGGFLYANNNRTLRRYSLTDFASSTTFGISDFNDNRPILIDGTNVYVYNQPSSGHHIVKVPK